MLTIKLDKSNIYMEVSKHTSYEGVKQDESLYDKVRVKSGDRTMLERWWSDACGQVTTLMVPYITGVESTVDDFTMTLELPSNFDTFVQDELVKAGEEVVTDSLLLQWYSLLNIESQITLETQKYQLAQDKLKNLLFARKRPTRPTY